MVQALHGGALGEDVHVVGVLHLVEQGYDLRMRQGHAQADTGRSPCLGESVEHDKTRVLIQQGDNGRALGSKINVSLIHHHNTAERIKHLADFCQRQQVAGGVVRAAQESHLGNVPAVFSKGGTIELIPGLQHELDVVHVVDISTNLVHAIGRMNSYHAVHPGGAERTENQVDGLVAAVAQEDALRRHALVGGNLLLQLPLQRVGVAVVRGVVRALVRIQEHVGSLAGILIAGGAVGFELQDIRANESGNTRTLFFLRLLCHGLYAQSHGACVGIQMLGLGHELHGAANAADTQRSDGLHRHLALEAIHTQAAVGPHAPHGRQGVVGAAGVITRAFAAVIAHENGARVADR